MARRQKPEPQTRRYELMLLPVEFTFYPTNHSVVKADFRQPCIPYNMVHPGEEICREPLSSSHPSSVSFCYQAPYYSMAGHPESDLQPLLVFSGPIEQLHGTENPPPTWTLEVNSTDPVFFYW